MSSALLFALVILYLGLLFIVAYIAEKSKSAAWANNPYIYSLSLAVYCSAWTYYGSIGVASNEGLEYLAVYIGPMIIMPAWIFIMTKIVRIARVNRISSIADFISLRYGNSRILGALTALVCILAIVPYIGLQIKAVSETYHLLTKTATSKNILFDSATYIVLIIALFSSYFGTRYVDASEKRLGIISAVAMESMLKLLFFLLLGFFVVYGVFDGFTDIYTKASQMPDFAKKNRINGTDGGMNWLLLCLLSMTSMFLLPRQFHASVVENRKEKHIHTAIWVFPLYLLLINIFVFPIAWGGRILFAGQEVNPEFYSILIPQKFGAKVISAMVFLGGLSASVSMIILSSISLSVMLSNNIIIPYGWLDRLKIKNDKDNNTTIITIRKISIFILILLAFVFYKHFISGVTLFSVGMVAFVLISQLAPSFFGAIFWRRGTLTGSFVGILAGVIICYLLLILPIYLKIDMDYFTILKIPYLSSIANAFFWSITVNAGLFCIISISKTASYRERNYAEIFVDIDRYIRNHENAYIWKGTAYITDIEKILVKFLGKTKTNQAMRIFNLKYNISNETTTADARFIKFSENLLSGRIGTASARILIESVTKEDKISLPEVLKILEESRENITMNKHLTEQSQQLQKISNELRTANEALIIKDQQKDDFLDSVAHELRTPITAIRATGELLSDSDDMPDELKKEFLNNIISESDRLAEIINDILFLDKLESGTVNLNLNSNNISETYIKALKPLSYLFDKKGISIEIIGSESLAKSEYDETRMIQVFQNILGNALKFTPDKGKILTIFKQAEESIRISVYNSGSIIPEEDLDYVFEKFYQSKNQNIRKPMGTGLGLAISKKIILAHGGNISVQNKVGGVEMTLVLPLKQFLVTKETSA